MHSSLVVVLQMLVVAAAVGMVAKRIKIHYNIALVIAGVLVGAPRLVPHVGLNPDVVLQVFLPILLFEAALASDMLRLRENIVPISLLALPGMLATVFVAGAILRFGIGLSWPMSLLLGSILAATDTIAVIATFRKVRVPKRLETIVENESLFNDGTALVAFSTILEVVQRGAIDPLHGLSELVWVTGGGLLVGAAIGYIASELMRRTEDHLMEILLTVLVAYGSSLLAETVHASPVLAVVTAALVVGNVGWKGLQPTGKITIRSFWEVATFGVNSFVFLLIGLQVDFRTLIDAAPAIGWGLLALTAGRATAVYPLLALVRGRVQRVPLRWQHLLVWGNLKGSLSMALVLSLPRDLPHRDLLTAVVFGCTLVTLTVQGLSLAPLIRRMRIGAAGDSERRLAFEQGQLLAARAGQVEVDRLQQLGVLPLGVFQRMRATYQGVIARSEKRLRDILSVHSKEEARHTLSVRRHLLSVEKSAINDAVTAGILSDDVAAELTFQIDKALSELADGEEGR
jgi:monovalent cation:H+ antiporter, CPA1 family